jgi:hypothetical protein
MIPDLSNKIVNDSGLAQFIIYNSPILTDISSDFISSVREICYLSKDQTSDDKAIDIMIKYNIVDRDTVEFLISKNKINYK